MPEQLFLGSLRVEGEMSAIDPLDQLRKLAALKDEGIIEASEYGQLKAHLLSRVTAPPAPPAPERSAPARAADPAPVDLVIPPPLPVSPERVSEPQVIEAKRNLTAIEQFYRQAATTWNYRRLRSKRLDRRVRYYGLLLKARAKFENVALGKLGPVAITTCLGMLVGMVLAGIVSNFLVLSGLVGGCVFFVAAVHVLVMPGDEVLKERVRRDSEEASELKSHLVGDEKAFEQAKIQLDQAQEEFESLLAKFRSRRNMLLSMDWRLLRGRPFELFLRDIFEELGFKVTLTAKVGDQGIDLIAQRADLRLAVQAKGYAESVGNAAVQQAHAGMAFYKCNRCMVVTNSTFTAAATELAHRIGCVLIDGYQIHDLILGKVTF